MSGPLQQRGAALRAPFVFSGRSGASSCTGSLRPRREFLLHTCQCHRLPTCSQLPWAAGASTAPHVYLFSAQHVLPGFCTKWHAGAPRQRNALQASVGGRQLHWQGQGCFSAPRKAAQTPNANLTAAPPKKLDGPLRLPRLAAELRWLPRSPTGCSTAHHSTDLTFPGPA